MQLHKKAKENKEEKENKEDKNKKWGHLITKTASQEF